MQLIKLWTHDIFRYIASLGILICFILCICCNNITTEKTPFRTKRLDINVVLQSNKFKYKAGEDILASVTIRNITSETIIIFPSRIQINHVIYNIEDNKFIQSGTSSEEAFISHTNYKNKSKITNRQVFLDMMCAQELLPEQSYTREFNLKEFVHTIKKGMIGKYEISAKYQDESLLLIDKDDKIELRNDFVIDDKFKNIFELVTPKIIFIIE